MQHAPSLTYVGLGSNLGDRMAHLRAALAALAQLPGTTIRRVSSVYETAPWGQGDQPSFYNLVAEVFTRLSPPSLLAAALEIEARLGRVRDPARRWGPRSIDIDLLWYAQQARATPDLTLPHPRMLARGFVLVPMAELAPDLLIAGHPVREHLAALGPDPGIIRRVTSGPEAWCPGGPAPAASAAGGGLLP